MALSSIMAAPLILSVDLRTIPDWAREIILNKNLIAINQDPLGIIWVNVQLDGDVQVWRKPLKSDHTAVVVFLLIFNISKQIISSLLQFIVNPMERQLISVLILLILV